MSWFKCKQEPVVLEAPQTKPEPMYKIEPAITDDGAPGWNLMERYYDYVAGAFGIAGSFTRYRKIAFNEDMQVIKDAKSHLEGSALQNAVKP